jgi:hypothetical protein
MKRAKPVDRCINRAVAIHLRSHVAAHIEDAVRCAARFRVSGEDRLLGRAIWEIESNDSSAGRKESQRHRAPEPARSTGNDYNSVRTVARWLHPSLFPLESVLSFSEEPKGTFYPV